LIFLKFMARISAPFARRQRRRQKPVKEQQMRKPMYALLEIDTGKITPIG
jgi:hypothetical protein